MNLWLPSWQEGQSISWGAGWRDIMLVGMPESEMGKDGGERKQGRAKENSGARVRFLVC